MGVSELISPPVIMTWSRMFRVIPFVFLELTLMMMGSYLLPIHLIDITSYGSDSALANFYPPVSILA